MQGRSKEKASNGIPTSYIQKFLSIPKAIHSQIESLASKRISGLSNLLFALNLFDYLPKAKAGEIYAFLNNISYAISCDLSSSTFQSVATQLLEACPNLT